MEFVEMYEHYEQPERAFVDREEYIDWMSEALKHWYNRNNQEFGLRNIWNLTLSNIILLFQYN